MKTFAVRYAVLFSEMPILRATRDMMALFSPDDYAVERAFSVMH